MKRQDGNDNNTNMKIVTDMKELQAKITHETSPYTDTCIIFFSRECANMDSMCAKIPAHVRRGRGWVEAVHSSNTQAEGGVRHPLLCGFDHRRRVDVSQIMGGQAVE